jgi:thioredoxin
MTRDQFLERMRKNPLPVVVDVWASWCGPCRRMAPALDQMGSEFAGRVDVLKLDAGREPVLVQELGVLGVPTLLVYRGDQELARRVGAQSHEGLRTLFVAAESGLAPEPARVPAGERLFRLGVSALLFVVGWSAGPSPLILAVSALIFFSAVYDRCPIWRALSPRLKSLFRRLKANPTQ